MNQSILGAGFAEELIFQLSPCKVPSAELGLCCKVHCLRGDNSHTVLPATVCTAWENSVLFSTSGKLEAAWQDWIRHTYSHAFKSLQAKQVPSLLRLQLLQEARPEHLLSSATRIMTSLSFNRVMGTQHNLGKMHQLECKALCCTFPSQRA